MRLLFELYNIVINLLILKLVSVFHSEQLQEIRKLKLSRVICDNSDDIETIQVYVMVLPDNEM